MDFIMALRRCWIGGHRADRAIVGILELEAARRQRLRLNGLEQPHAREDLDRVACYVDGRSASAQFARGLHHRHLATKPVQPSRGREPREAAPLTSTSAPASPARFSS